MPKKFDDCVRDVKKKIREGEIPKTYIDEKGRRRKTNPYDGERESPLIYLWDESVVL